MAKEDENPQTPLASKPSPNSQASSSHPRNNKDDTFQFPKKSQNPEEFILSVASNIASQPLQYSDPEVWGVLTAISDRARKRRQGINMLLTSDEHRIGRLVDDVRFQILSNQISANHCKIYRKRVATEDADSPSKFCNSIFLRDTSTNGTYLNWEKLNKHSPETKLHHGDIISFSAPPQHELAYAFVFRNVLKSTSLAGGSHLKRKAEELGYEGKRQRGIGIGAPEGPISLDDFRSLQRSNTELRKQLENQVVTIDSLRGEIHEAIERHETEKKDLKESVSKSYLDELKDLRYILEAKQKELVEVNRISSEQKHKLEDINERLSASLQSCTEANDLINSQKASISELRALVNEEREQRKEEREKAAVDLKASIQRVQAEAQEELKRVSDNALRREKEQQEIINKLQESEKQTSSQVEILRSKLEDTRQKSVMSDNKVRHLEALVCAEKLTSANARKRVEELEKETIRLRKELENEKQAAREEAWAKVSALELEMNSAMRDLDFERRRFKAARERIMLRETQLRTFYSTTEEISALFAKQQEQLKAMQKTLEDEENCENIPFDIDPNPSNVNGNESLVKGKQATGSQNPNTSKANSSNEVQISSDKDSVTEKHECDTRNQENGEETQEVEFTSADRLVKGAFGSDINGVDTAPVLEGDPVETERVFETETQRNFDLNKCSALEGDTMQLDDETLGQEAEERGLADSNTHLVMREDPGGSIGGVADSQCGASPEKVAAAEKWNLERRALREMIGIIAPDLKEQFEGDEKEVASNSDTEDCTDEENGGVNSDSASDADTDGGDRKDRRFGEPMGDDDGEATQDDTIG
ncbi:hypothetical protein LguiA_019188 [Lonicera macranthoides]